MGSPMPSYPQLVIILYSLSSKKADEISATCIQKIL